MKIVFRPMNGSDRTVVMSMIKGLYSEDPSGKEMTPEKIRKTFDELTNHPERGTIWVMEKDPILVGYAITINYWSNEYGGNILFLDELYVIPSERGSGIGSTFIRYLKEERPDNAVAILLEVLPTNVGASNFYSKVGFQLSRYHHYVMVM
jgi:GNAT superfamily N-acetyltransferase